ncbi:arylsulfatase [Methylocaldum marinum]|uniref:Arylsulfatase n=1 Tax=Methylocaldum marinum TaxID=1432792 RepID=A0A286P442_9GAMM|nr:sulfatase [Methylocaldum marinum]BBA32414.1 arylsulfatase [Methylocaldum marinum]
MSPSAAFVHALLNGALASLIVAAAVALLLTVISLMHLDRTGPQIRDEVLAHFRGYFVYSLGRLAFWVWLIAFYLGLSGHLLYLAGCIVIGTAPGIVGSFVAVSAGIGVITGARFLRLLWFSPATLIASFNYSYRKLARLWRILNTSRIRLLRLVLITVAASLLGEADWLLLVDGRTGDALVLTSLSALWAAIAIIAISFPEPAPAACRQSHGRPNILMIGSDTLRADRLGLFGHSRNLTPFIDSLAQRGTWFSSCYVPCARTAPSLTSLLTGCWPHTHGVRDNFVSDEETRLTVPCLPELLRQAGYRTAAVADWCGADLGKFPYGFDVAEVPEDQWNLKFLLRQGPKELRLFLSLFCHNRFGKRFLPEIYYLAGVPLNHQVGRDARKMLNRLAQDDRPFFLNVFIAATHPPFGCEYPYYTLYSNPAYEGDSKFVMARLTDPWDVISRQADPKEAFHLDQIIDLYDGCVRAFDREVENIVGHLSACGLLENTIIVIYSDHGFEFFEHETWGQGNSAIGDESARVPLVMVGPGIAERRHVDQIVRTVDIAPTLLELTGEKVHPEMEGQSLVPCLNAEEHPKDLGLAAFNETGIWLTRVPGMPDNHLAYPNLMELLEVPDKSTGTLGIRSEYRRIIIRAKDRMIRDGRWKLTFRPLDTGPLYELYDMETDPECRRNVLALYPDIASRLKSRMEDWLNADRQMNGQKAATMALEAYASSDDLKGLAQK